ncbi:hypothetical protein NHH03_26455 [Stieleria sp. TO1_6]|uniref:Vgb family protein n=1 Tax=Stieleria tagensis TaxID=2956795 RepID=UPI00209B37EF|nr:hypothetical protein [Stieleria tagensis]MCO8125308.1 hypothetical protein [Stieleria tagensis]
MATCFLGGLTLATASSIVVAQESEPQTDQKDATEQPAETAPAGEDDSQTDVYGKSVQVPDPIAADQAAVNYPRAVALQDGNLLVVDLDLPGIWVQADGTLKLRTAGTKLLRKPMNRPWCVTAHPDGGILIGDSATREIYYAAAAGGDLISLNNGYLGIPMAIAVDPSGEMIYVGDAERRAVFRLPIGGGKPELVARVNARGLSFDSDGMLWAVTPDAEAVQRIDVKSGTAETIVGDRPYQFPNGIAWAGDRGFVTDGYGKSIWTFTADGKTEKWFEGDPLGGPVGITADDESLYVADPQKKQVFRFDRKTKAVEPVL